MNRSMDQMDDPRPEVINEQHARMHPKFDEYVAQFHATPKYNGDAYEARPIDSSLLTYIHAHA